MLQEKLKGVAEVAGPDANRINAAHAAKTQRAREEKVPDLIIAALQKLVREIGSTESAFQAGVGAQFDTQIRQGANRELFQALQADVDAFTRKLAKTVRSIESEARGFEERINLVLCWLYCRARRPSKVPSSSMSSLKCRSPRVFGLWVTAPQSQTRAPAGPIRPRRKMPSDKGR